MNLGRMVVGVGAACALALGGHTNPATAGLLGPSNFWECVLEKMPGVQNDPVAYQIAADCNTRFPNPPEISGKDKVGGLFSVPHAPECVIRYAKNTRSNFGAQLITAACYQLYWP